MHKLAVATILLATLGTAAAAPLTTTVFTGSPGGFLVDSTLIAGDKEAILVDAQFDLADAHRLVAMILESKKALTTIYVTHFHPDHYFGLAVLKQAFPKAKVVALPAAVAEIKKTWAAKVKQWQPLYGDNLSSAPPIPTALAGTALALEGQAIEIHGGVQGDDVDNSYLWIPSTKTLIAGDIVYHGVHPWTHDTTPAQRRAWAKTLDEVAALHPTTVIAGHKDPKTPDDAAGITETRGYLEAFDAAVVSSKSAAEVQQKVKAKYPALELDIILELGAKAAFPK